MSTGLQTEPEVTFERISIVNSSQSYFALLYIHLDVQQYLVMCRPRFYAIQFPYIMNYTIIGHLGIK